jgi:predicted nucleic acid-binding protein
LKNVSAVVDEDLRRHISVGCVVSSNRSIRQVVTNWCRSQAPEFSWNVFLRLELRHNLRRISGDYAAVAWHAYRAAETSGRLRLGVHRLSELLDWGDELSAKHALKSTAGTWDCVHVAIARHARIDTFLTCDIAQAELAKLTGLRVHLFK